VWAIAANVVQSRPYGPGGTEIRRGLELFAGRAKVYVAGGFAGMGYETATVIGRTRHSQRYSAAHIRTEHLTQWRVELVYSPAAMRRIHQVREDSQGGFGLDDLDPASAAYRDKLVEIADGLSRGATRERERRLTGDDGDRAGIGRLRWSAVGRAVRGWAMGAWRRARSRTRETD
jgi:hypothetical protein